MPAAPENAVKTAIFEKILYNFHVFVMTLFRYDVITMMSRGFNDDEPRNKSPSIDIVIDLCRAVAGHGEDLALKRKETLADG